MCTSVLALFFDLSTYLSNVPLYTIFSGQVYRLFISFLAPDNELSLDIMYMIFCCLLMTYIGFFLEALFGSAMFLWLIFLFGALINVIFNLLCLLLFVSGFGTEALELVCTGFRPIVWGFTCLYLSKYPFDIGNIRTFCVFFHDY